MKPERCFNSTKVRLRPAVSAVRLPIDSGGADGAKVIKAIQKMSMQNNIFSAGVRQLLLDAEKY